MGVTGSTRVLWTLCAFLCVCTCSMGAWTWQESSYGVYLDDAGRDVALASDGTSFLAGVTRSAFPGNTNMGGADAYVMRVSADGTREWVRQWGSSQDETVEGVALCGDGSVFVVMTALGPVDGQSFLGQDDIVLTKWYGNGTKAWTLQFGSNNRDLARGVACGQVSYDAYVCGESSGSPFTGAGGGGATNGADGFVTRVSPEGSVVWTMMVVGADADTANAVAVDSTDTHVYVGGQSKNQKIDDFTGSYAGGSYDGWVAAYGTTLGTFQWGHMVGSSGDDMVHGVTVPASGGVVGCGTTSGTIGTPSNAGNTDAFVTRYNQTGVQWQRMLGSTQTDEGHACVASGVVVYVAGDTSGSMGGQTQGTGTDAFVSKVSVVDGTPQWTRQVAVFGTATGLGIDANLGQVVLAGKQSRTRPSPNDFLWDGYVRMWYSNGTLGWEASVGQTEGYMDDRAQAVTVAADAGVVLGVGYAVGGMPTTGAASSKANPWVSWLHPDTGMLTRAEEDETIDARSWLHVGMQSADYMVLAGEGGFIWVGGQVDGTPTTNVVVKRVRVSTGLMASITSRPLGALVSVNGAWYTQSTNKVYFVGSAPNTPPLQSQTMLGGSDGFVTSFNVGTESIEWTRITGSAQDDSAVAVTASSDGEAVFVVAMSNAGAGTVHGQPTVGGFDPFVVRYHSNGTRAWVRLWGTAVNDVPGAVALSPDGTRLFVGGRTNGVIGDEGGINAGGDDAWVSMLWASNGSLAWTHQYGSSGSDNVNSMWATARGVFVAGTTGNSMHGATHQGLDDVFVLFVARNGTREWTRQWGTGASDTTTGVALGNRGKLVVSGYSRGVFNTSRNLGGTESSFVSSVAVQCAPGSESAGQGMGQDDVACAQCVAGKASLAYGEECQACGKGTYTGTGGQSACSACDAGTFNNVTGSTGCTGCGIGTYSPSGASACVDCPMGSFGNSSALGACLLCPPNTYNNQTGQTSETACLACPANVSSLAGSSSCGTCLHGSVTRPDNSTVCVECPWVVWQNGEMPLVPQGLLGVLGYFELNSTVPPANMSESAQVTPGMAYDGRWLQTTLVPGPMGTRKSLPLANSTCVIDIAWQVYTQTQVWPNVGNGTAGVRVTVLGSRLENRGGLQCHVGTQQAVVVWINTTQVDCVLPALTEGTYEVRLTMDGGKTFAKGSWYRVAVDARVDQLLPSQVPVLTPINATLIGSGFVDTGSRMRVRVGTRVVPHRLVSSQELIVVLPSLFQSRYKLQVTFNDGADWLAPPTNLRVFAPEASDLLPRELPEAKATSLVIRGSGFVEVSRLLVRIGSNPVIVLQGQRMSDTAINVTTPALSEGTYTVEVSNNNGTSFTALVGQTLRVYAAGSFNRTVPSATPVTGGTSMRLMGVIPSVQDVPRVQLRDTNGWVSAGVAGTRTSTEQVTVTTPAYGGNLARPVTVSVWFANNGQDYVDTGLSVTIYDAPQVLDVAPLAKQSSASVEVTITGSGFVDTGSSAVAVLGSPGAQVVFAGTVVSSTQMTFVSGLSHAVGTYPVGVSLDGGQTVSGGAGTAAVTFTVTPETIACPQNSEAGIGATSVQDCVCKPLFFSPTGNGGVACVACPPNGVCAGGLSAPVAANGFYSTGTGNQYQFTRCAVASACVLSGNGTLCATGYEGLLCGQCQSGYFRLGDRCQACSDDQHFTLVLFVGLFVVYLWFVKRQVRQTSRGVITLAITHLQVMATFAEFRLSWPAEAQEILEVFSLSNLSVDTLAPECTVTSVWTYEHRFWMTMAMPVVVTVGLLLRVLLQAGHHRFVESVRGEMYSRYQWLVGFPDATRNKVVYALDLLRYNVFSSLLTESDPVDEETWRHVINEALFSLGLLYITLCGRVLEVFDCTRLANGLSVLDALPTEQCWGGAGTMHGRLVPAGIVFGVVYVVGIPLAFLVITLSGRDVEKRHDESFSERFSSIYNKYDERFFWFEAVVLLRKVGIVCVRIFATTLPAVQGVGGMIVLGAATLVQYAYKPYRTRAQNWLESVMFVQSLLLLAMGLLFYTSSFTNGGLVSLWNSIAFYLTLSVFAVCGVFFLRDIAVYVNDTRLAYNREQSNSDMAMFLENVSTIIRADHYDQLQKHADAHLDQDERNRIMKAVSVLRRKDMRPSEAAIDATHHPIVATFEPSVATQWVAYALNQELCDDDQLVAKQFITRLGVKTGNGAYD